MTVQHLYDLIDRFAPFATQADGDNSGFLVGSASQEVTGVLFALDVTEPVIDEAVSLGAQLIVTHHPLMFSPVHAMTDGNYEGRLIRRLTRENISLIAAHTNLDQAPGGINDTLAERCGLTDVSGEGYFRCGLLPAPLSAGDFAADAGCDAFVSGEIRHHHALAMAGSGIVGFECGHFGTEEPGIRALASALQNAVNTVECKVRICVSGVSAYSFPGNRDRR